MFFKFRLIINKFYLIVDWNVRKLELGKKTQTGVYVYVIEYKNADGESRTINGDVMVILENG